MFLATLKLKPKAVPSQFSWNYESEERKEIKRKRAERVLERRKKRETATICLTKKNQCEEHFVSKCKTFFKHVYQHKMHHSLISLTEHYYLFNLSKCLYISASR